MAAEAIHSVPNIHQGYVDLGPQWAGCQVHYRRAGSHHSPPLLLLHQTPSTSAMYLPLMHELASRYQLWAFDTPGFGQSSPLPGVVSIAESAAALAAAARQLGLAQAAWFGHHTGAALALQLAHSFPAQVSHLMMSGPCLLDAALRERLPKLVPTLGVDREGEHLSSLWQRIRAKDPDAPAEIWQRDVLAGLAAGERYEQAYQAVVAVETETQLRCLRIPTLVFAGSEDPLYSRLEPAYRLLADGEMAVIPGARTFVCERNVAEVARLLQKFLNEKEYG